MSPGTAVAVLVDALTTIVGFGSLMIATHQGLQSLGRVLTIGVTCCLFTSLVMLPALLTWMTRHRAEMPADATTAATPHRRASALRRRYDAGHSPVGLPHSSPAPRTAPARRGDG